MFDFLETELFGNIWHHQRCLISEHIHVYRYLCISIHTELRYKKYVHFYWKKHIKKLELEKWKALLCERSKTFILLVVSVIRITAPFPLQVYKYLALK